MKTRKRKRRRKKKRRRKRRRRKRTHLPTKVQRYHSLADYAKAHWLVERKT